MNFQVFMDAELVGVAQILQTRTRQRRIAFTYEQQWLTNPQAFPISPEMPLDAGRHEPPVWKNLPYAFDDAAPDRWGRDLLQAEHRKIGRASCRERVEIAGGGVARKKRS